MERRLGTVERGPRGLKEDGCEHGGVEITLLYEQRNLIPNTCPEAMAVTDIVCCCGLSVVGAVHCCQKLRYSCLMRYCWLKVSEAMS